MKGISAIWILVWMCSCGSADKGQVEPLSQIKSEIKTEEAEKVETDNIDASYADYWCSTEILVKTSEKIEDLDLVLVADFLATFNSECRNNAEYSEWSNKLLFEVCSIKPALVHHLLSKNSSLDRNGIIEQLESPIHDGIELDRVLKGFQDLEPLELEGSETWKMKMIKGINKAKEKST